MNRVEIDCATHRERVVTLTKEEEAAWRDRVRVTLPVPVDRLAALEDRVGELERTRLR